MVWFITPQATRAHFVRITGGSIHALIFYGGMSICQLILMISIDLYTRALILTMTVHRHVGKSHPEKTKDDQELQKVLDKRPNGPNHG
jgi:hypothetical protein